MKHFRLLLFVGLLFATTSQYAATCTAVTGNWEAPGTWSCGRLPTCGDVVVIPAGVTVTITSQLDYTALCAGPMEIDIFGTLHFQNGKRLTLNCGSIIFVQSGGSVTGGGGGGSSNLIDICGATAWTSGSGNVSGPASITAAGVGGLPIELLYFTVFANKTHIDLSWASATETNNNFYSIERSQDGIVFNEIQKINTKALKGTSLLKLEYEYSDTKPLSGTSYYRLRQTDFNGKNEVFNIASANFLPDKKINFTVYPNPNQGEFTIDFTGLENNHEVQVLMHDLEGKEVYSTSFYMEQSASSLSIIPQDKLSKGIYMCSLVVEGIKYSVKVIVN